MSARRGWVLGALAASTIVAIGLRLWGIRVMLPHDLEGDARILFQIRVLRGLHPEGRGDAYFGQYPLLFAYLDQLVPLDAPDAPPSTHEEHLAAASRLALRGRTMIALIASLLVPLTYRVARAWLSPPASVLAAALVATSSLHLSYSQQARPHAASAVLVLLALVAAASLARRGGVARWLGASVACALALGALHNGIACLLPLAAATLVRVRADGRRALALGALALVPVLAAIPIFYPFLVQTSAEHGARQLAVEGEMLEQAGHKVWISDFRGAGFARMADIAWTYEPWLVVAAGIGALALALRGRAAARARGASGRGAERLVLAAYALPYALVLGMYERTPARFCTPLVPFAAILAAGGVAAAVATARAKLSFRVARAVGVALVLVTLGASAATAARQSWLRARPDTQALAARWLVEHVDPARTRILVLPRVFLPLFRQRGGVAGTYASQLAVSWDEYEPVHRSDAGVERRWRVTYLTELPREELQLAREHPQRFVESLAADVVVLQTMPEARLARWYNRVVEHVRGTRELLAHIGPDEQPGLTDAFLHYDDPRDGVPRPHRAWRLWHATRFGPVIEIYALRRRAQPR